MRHIEKDAEPRFLLEFKKGLDPDWRPSFAALRDEKEIRNQLKAALLLEQGHVCCYCCRRIEADSSHFEHFHCQEKFPELDIEYGNLLASCNSEGPRRHCGARKENQTLEICPLDPDCERLFTFDFEGRIAGNPAGHPAAEEAIALLGLNQALLRESRRQAILGFTEGIDGFSDQEIRKLASWLQDRDAEGRFEAFQPAILQALNRFLPAP